MENTIIIIIIAIATALAFIINLYLTPLLIYISRKHGIYDKIDDRKVHTEDTSRLGGIGIFTSVLISLLISPLIMKVVLNYDSVFHQSPIKIPYFISSITVIFITGILDDFAQIRARYKLLGQLIASILAIAGGALISQVEIPFSSITLNLGYLAIPITIIWFIGITNALNLIDGIDGLSAGISIIAAIIYGFVFLLHGQFLAAIISFIIVGALLGYLFFNFPPAKIFMGDSGSLFLGFVLALLPIATRPQSGTSLFLPITMLLIPILDVISAIWRRKRDKKDIFTPDRFHVHHKLMNMGLNNRNILAIIYGLCLLLGISAIIYESSKVHNFITVLPSWIVVSLFFIYIHYKKRTHK